jgi:hypothetical protein
MSHRGRTLDAVSAAVKKAHPVKHAKAALNPTAAPGYFTGKGTRNWEPALLWLVIAVIALHSLRTGRLPNGDEVATYAILGVVVVIGGAVAPGIIAIALVGLLVAGALNLNNKLTTAIDTFTVKVADLSKPQT